MPADVAYLTLGLQTHAVVFPQPLTPHVRFNLRVGLAAGVRFSQVLHPAGDHAPDGFKRELPPTGLPDHQLPR